MQLQLNCSIKNHQKTISNCELKCFYVFIYLQFELLFLFNYFSVFLPFRPSLSSYPPLRHFYHPLQSSNPQSPHNTISFKTPLNSQSSKSCNFKSIGSLKVKIVVREYPEAHRDPMNFDFSELTNQHRKSYEPLYFHVLRTFITPFKFTITYFIYLLGPMIFSLVSFSASNFFWFKSYSLLNHRKND